MPSLPTRTITTSWGDGSRHPLTALPVGLMGLHVDATVPGL